MLTEGDTPEERRTAELIGDGLNADYCSFEFDEHENVTLVLKYGAFDSGDDVDSVLQYIQEGQVADGGDATSNGDRDG